MRQQRDYPRHARIQRIDRNDAEYRTGCRQTCERGPALPAKRAVFHNRAGDKGIIPFFSIGGSIVYPESKIKEMLEQNYYKPAIPKP